MSDWTFEELFWSLSVYVYETFTAADRLRKLKHAVCAEHAVCALLFSGPRCQNYKSQAAPGQSNSRVSAAGWVRGAAWTASMTAAPRQGVLWRPQTRVRHLSQQNSFVIILIMTIIMAIVCCGIQWKSSCSDPWRARQPRMKRKISGLEINRSRWTSWRRSSPGCHAVGKGTAHPYYHCIYPQIYIQ